MSYIELDKMRCTFLYKQWHRISYVHCGSPQNYDSNPTNYLSRNSCLYRVSLQTFVPFVTMTLTTYTARAPLPLCPYLLTNSLIDEWQLFVKCWWTQYNSRCWWRESSVRVSCIYTQSHSDFQHQLITSTVAFRVIITIPIGLPIILLLSYDY